MKKSGSGALKGGLLKILLPVFLCVALVVWFFFSWLSWVGNAAVELQRLGLKNASIPMSLTVFGRSVDTISARLGFYTLEGERLSSIERSWLGWELKIDSIVVRAGEGWLVFPFLVYTDESSRGKGLNLFRFYDQQKFPALYQSASLTAGETLVLQRLFRLVKTESWMPFFLGSLRHETVVIRSFEPNVEYSLHVDADGSLRLKQN